MIEGGRQCPEPKEDSVRDTRELARTILVNVSQFNCMGHRTNSDSICCFREDCLVSFAALKFFLLFFLSENC